jgi:hypothetical protein
MLSAISLSPAVVSHDTPFPCIRSRALPWVLAFPCSIAWRFTALGQETNGRRLLPCIPPPCNQREGNVTAVPPGHADLAIARLGVFARQHRVCGVAHVRVTLARVLSSPALTADGDD